jgi:hypothetical protein
VTEREIPEHESVLRRMMADAHGDEYVAYPSLEEARRDPDAALVMQGDDGGQIYVTCPVSLVAADEPTLRRLLEDLDAIAWPGADADMRSLHYERRPIGSGVAGGMGGGRVTTKIWVHDEFIRAGVAGAAQAVIRGERARIPRPRG